MDLSKAIFAGKSGTHNSCVVRTLINGPKTAYDLHKANEDAMEYSTSNRRLRSLERLDIVARHNGQRDSGGRKKINYRLTFKGSIAALLLTPALTDTEFITLLRHYSDLNRSYNLFDKLMGMRVSIDAIRSAFEQQIKDALQTGRLSLDAEDKTLEVLIMFELMKSIAKPMDEDTNNKRRIVEAVYNFVKSCPFESVFGNMTVVILAAIAQSYLRNNGAYRRMFVKIDGKSRYTFNPLNDDQALEVMPFLDPTYSKVANESWKVFSDLSSFIYTMYDEFGEP